MVDIHRLKIIGGHIKPRVSMWVGGGSSKKERKAGAERRCWQQNIDFTLLMRSGSMC